LDRRSGILGTPWSLLHRVGRLLRGKEEQFDVPNIGKKPLCVLGETGTRDTRGNKSTQLPQTSKIQPKDLLVDTHKCLYHKESLQHHQILLEGEQV
jgi:hypothetical protein